MQRTFEQSIRSCKPWMQDRLIILWVYDFKCTVRETVSSSFQTAQKFRVSSQVVMISQAAKVHRKTEVSSQVRIHLKRHFPNLRSTIPTLPR